MDHHKIIEEEPKTLQDYLHILLFHKWKVIIITILVFVLSILKLIFTIPQYKANAVVMIEQDDQVQKMFDFKNSMGDKTIANEIEIVKSRHVAKRLVEKIAKSPYSDNLYILGTRKYSSDAIDFKRNLTKKVKEFLPIEGSKSSSGSTAEKKEANYQAIANRIANGDIVEISNRRETNILDISFKSIDSLEAIFLTNQFIEAYQQADIAWSSEEISHLNDFLQEQLDAAQAELVKAENKLQQYQEEATVFGVEAEIQPLLEQATKAETELANTETSIKIAQDKKRYLEKQFSQKEKELARKISNSIETKLDALRQELGYKEAELIRTKKSAGTGHQAIRRLEEDIAEIRHELEVETNKMIQNGISVANPLEYSQGLLEKVLALEAELSGLEAKKNELQKAVENYNKRISRLPEKQLKYVRFERNRKVLAESYLFLRNKMEEAKIKKASESGKIRIIDRATVAEKTQPKTKQDLLLGLVLGLGLGVGFVLLIDFMDNTIRTVDDIERTGLSLMGTVPLIDRNAEKKVKKSKKSRKRKNLSLHDSIIAHFDPKSPITESYRSIRTNINLTAVDEDKKTILISSPGPGEGKTTTVSNLAITFANLGKKTLLVDCDLRKPKIHTVFGLSNNMGLVNTFDTENHLEPLELVQEVDEADNLFVITSGGIPANPSELLGSKRMQKNIDVFKNNFDIVLFDTPPFTAVTDPIMLSREMDVNLMVLKAGETNKKSFYRSIHNLHQIKVKPSGVILNGLSKRTSYDGYYNYQNYYHYYAEENKK